MKRSWLPMILGMTLLFAVWSASCASSPLLGPPPLKDRVLELAPDFPGFYFQYRVCTKHFLVFCTQSVMQKDIYDLRDETTRKQLLAAGFVGRVRDRPSP